MRRVLVSSFVLTLMLGCDDGQAPIREGPPFLTASVDGAGGVL